MDAGLKKGLIRELEFERAAYMRVLGAGFHGVLKTRSGVDRRASAAKLLFVRCGSVA
jgi:hypothetical protein